MFAGVEPPDLEGGGIWTAQGLSEVIFEAILVEACRHGGILGLSIMASFDLVALALEHYGALDVEAKRLLALKRLYWPA